MNQDLIPLKQAYPNYFANYIDNITIEIDNSKEGHKLHHKIVYKFLEILQEHSYFLKVFKCKFKKDQIYFLGFRLGHQTVKIDPTKIGEIVDWPQQLKSQKKVQQILRVLGYQWAFIQDYSQLAKPLTNLLKKETPFT
jgi:hypothetical protein